MMLIPVSDQRLVGVSVADAANVPVEALTEALRSGDGGLGKDAKMAALLKTTDCTRDIWAVAEISESYRQVDFLTPFQEVRLVTERKADGLHVLLTAVGADAGKVKRAVALFERQLKAAHEQIRRQAEHAPSLKGYVTVLGTVKAEVDGKQARVSVTVKAELSMESPLLAMALATTASMGPFLDESGEEDVGTRIEPGDHELPVAPEPP
jgi:hypothetical protein